MGLAEPDISRVPIMIDSSKWEIIEASNKRRGFFSLNALWKNKIARSRDKRVGI